MSIADQATINELKAQLAALTARVAALEAKKRAPANGL